jgi:hypothetical protein
VRKQLELFDDIRRVPKKWARGLMVCVKCGSVPVVTVVPRKLCQECAPALGEEDLEVLAMGCCGIRRG